MAIPTAEQVFTWALRYRLQAEKDGRGTCYPTLRQAARKFRCRISQVRDVVEQGLDDDQVFGLLVGFRTGSGVGLFEQEGDYQIEAEENEETNR